MRLTPQQELELIQFRRSIFDEIDSSQFASLMKERQRSSEDRKRWETPQAYAKRMRKRAGQ